VWQGSDAPHHQHSDHDPADPGRQGEQEQAAPMMRLCLTLEIDIECGTAYCTACMCS
jgi:hypothetical protein